MYEQGWWAGRVRWSVQVPWNRDDDAAAGTLETMHTALIGGVRVQSTEKPSD